MKRNDMNLFIENITLATGKVVAKCGLIIAGAALLVICSPCSAAEIAVSVGKVALEPGESQSIKVVCDNQDKRENALC